MTPDLEEGMTAAARQLAEEEKKKAIQKKLYGKALGDGFSEKYTPDSVRKIGQERTDQNDDELLKYATDGGLENLDPATLNRMLDSMSPDQAERVIQALKKR